MPAYLTIAGTDVPVAEGGLRQKRDPLGTTERMYDGGLMSDERPGKRTWTGPSAIMSSAAFTALEALSYQFQTCTGMFVLGASVTCFVIVAESSQTIEFTDTGPVTWFEASLELREL